MLPGEDAAGVAASGGADDDQARRLVAGERVQRAWHRGIGDGSRVDSELVAQTGQLRPDGLVVDRVEVGPPAAIGCPRDGGDNHVRAVSSAAASASSTGAWSLRNGL